MPRRAALHALTLLLAPALVTAAQGGPAPCPLAGDALDCTPIRPGARLTEPYACTLGFVYVDAQGGLYASTAGHCTDRVGQRVSARGAPDFGAVVFREGAGGRADFALLRVDEASRALVSPRLCGMGGPTGVAPASVAEGTRLHLYGHAAVLGEAPPARGREGALVSAGSTRWSAAFPSVPGDSGAPVVLATGEAVGHLTGISGGFVFIPGRPPQTPMIAGPRLASALALAEGATGLDLALATAPLATPGERAHDAAAAAFAC